MNNDEKWNNCRRECDQAGNVDIEKEVVTRDESTTKFQNDWMAIEDCNQVRNERGDNSSAGSMHSITDRYNNERHRNDIINGDSENKKMNSSWGSNYDKGNGSFSSFTLNNYSHSGERRYQDKEKQQFLYDSTDQRPLLCKHNSAEMFKQRAMPNSKNSRITPCLHKRKDITSSRHRDVFEENVVGDNDVEEKMKYVYGDELYTNKNNMQKDKDEYRKDRSTDFFDYNRKNKTEEQMHMCNSARRYTTNDTSSYIDNTSQRFDMQGDYMGRRTGERIEEESMYQDGHYEYNGNRVRSIYTYDNHDRDIELDEYTLEKMHNNRDAYFESFHQTPHGEVKNSYYNPFAVKHRRRTSKMQLRVLEKTFETNIRPDAALRKILGEQLGMTPRSVQVWFQNRRAKIKKSKKNDCKKDSNHYEDRNGEHTQQHTGYYNKDTQYYNNRMELNDMDYGEGRVRAHSVAHPETYLSRQPSFSNEHKLRANSVVYPETYMATNPISYKPAPILYPGQFTHSNMNKSSNGMQNSVIHKGDNYINGMYFSPISPQDAGTFYAKAEGEQENAIEKKSEYNGLMEDTEDYETKFMNL